MHPSVERASRDLAVGDPSPIGDHAGSTLAMGVWLPVSRVRLPVGTDASHRAPLGIPPLADLLWKAMREPSGDQSG